MVKIVNIGNRIVEARKAKGYNQKEFAQLLGVEPSHLNRWELNKIVPRQETIALIANKTGVSTDWLISGYSEKSSETQILKELTYEWNFLKQPKEEVLAQQQPDRKISEYVSVNTYSLDYLKNPDDNALQVPLQILTVLPAEFIKESSVAFQMVGSAMEPSINDQAIIGLNHTEKSVIDGKIYIIRTPDNTILVRRLFMGINGLILSADNPQFSKMEVSSQNIQIIGRVSWIIQTL